MVFRVKSGKNSPLPKGLFEMRTRAAAVNILSTLPRNYCNYEKKVVEVTEKLNYSQRDQDFVYILVKGVIQYKKLLDYILEIATNKPLSKLEIDALNLLRIGLFQSVILNTPGYALVNETAEAARDLQRSDLVPFVNAVLRHLPDERVWLSSMKNLGKVESLAIKNSHPEWLVKRWIEAYGEKDTVKLLEFNNDYQEIIFRHNPIKIGWEGFEQKITNDGYSINLVRSKPIHFFTTENPGVLLKNRLFNEGYYSVQDFSQALAVLILDPNPGEMILDVCAAPGGKSTFIAQLVGKKGKIVSSDITKNKIALLENECSRLGIDFINYMVADAGKDTFFEVDKILVDVPCSGTGVLSRRADMRWNRKSSDIVKLKQLQTEILNNVSKYVHNRGVLVYSTCSIEFDENWGVVEAFLHSHLDFVIDRADKYIEADYCDEYGAVQILPQKHGMTGSFAVRMVRLN